MANIKYNFKLNVKGIMSIDGDQIVLSVEDGGDFNFADLCADFNGKLVKISVAYEEDYSSDEDDDDLDVDLDTGEVIE